MAKTNWIIAFFVLLALVSSTNAATETGVFRYQNGTTHELNGSYVPELYSAMSATVTATVDETSPYDVPTSGLVGHWKMDEGSNIYMNDASGNGNNGTASTVAWADGKYDTGVRFSGTSSVVTVTDSATLQSCKDSYTLIFSMNRTNITSAHAEDFVSYIGGSPNKYIFYITAPTSTHRVRCSIYDGTNLKIVDSDVTPATNVFHTYAFRRDNSTRTLSIFYDGQLVKTENDTTYNLSGPSTFRFGAASSTSPYCVLDNIMLWNRSLSDSEIAQVCYDDILDLQLKTNSGSTYSDEIDGSGNVEIPFTDAENITQLEAIVPTSATIGGVTVRDYVNSVSPFSFSLDLTPLPPVAGFSSVSSGRTAFFTCGSTGAEISCVWDFGDGETSTETSPVHIYDASGTYSVTLTCTNDAGSDSDTQTIEVILTNSETRANNIATVWFSAIGLISAAVVCFFGVFVITGARKGEIVMGDLPVMALSVVAILLTIIVGAVILGQF